MVGARIQALSCVYCADDLHQSLGTIVNMMVFVCVPVWGEWVAYLSWG